MWYVCKLTFDVGESSGIEAKTFEGIRQGMDDVIREWGAPHVTGIVMARIQPNEIKQGRIGEYARHYYSENPDGQMYHLGLQGLPIRRRTDL